MSLRKRILILFISFAVLPVLLLALGDYLQSVQALRAAIDVQREALADRTARDVERSYTRAQEALRAVGERLAHGETEQLVDDPDELSLAFDSIHIIAEDGSRRAVQLPDRDRRRPAGCSAGPDPVVVRVDYPTSSGKRAVEGVLDLSDLAASTPSLTTRLGHDGFTRIVDPSTGTILLDTGCLGDDPTDGDPEAVQTVEARGAGVAPAPDDEAEWRVSTAQLTAPEWRAVVYSSDRAFIAGFRSSRLPYIAVVLAVLLAAAGLFAILAQGSLRSLRSLTRAADEVELGNMRPWLPPPGEDEVGRLSLAFRKMTDRIDASIRQSELNQKLVAVGELASYLSHEIRNPLSSIRLGLQTLHRDLSAGFIPPDASRIIGISLNEVKRLDDVVRTVLEVGRDRDAIDDDTTCDLHASIHDAVDVIMPKVRSRSVELEFRPGTEHSRVVGDAEALRGVWLNLIVNALDALADREDGRILITTRSVSDNEMHVRVADNGPGVPVHAVESLFEPFFTTKDRGNGLGLATASKTIQAAGGSITYEEGASLNGAVFLVHLKLAESASAEVREDTENLETVSPFQGAA